MTGSFVVKGIANLVIAAFALFGNAVTTHTLANLNTGETNTIFEFHWTWLVIGIACLVSSVANFGAASEWEIEEINTKNIKNDISKLQAKQQVASNYLEALENKYKTKKKKGN